MSTAQLVLEYLKVFLTPQIVIGTIVVVFVTIFRPDILALFRRIATIRLPGGTELSTSQSAKIEDEPDRPPPTPPSSADVALPPSLDANELRTVRELLDAERMRAFVWEYRYLNYFLVQNSQRVLDWFASLPQRTSIQLFDTVWMPLIANAQERRAILNALQTHHLIVINNDLVEVTPKGREYIQWRGGPLPPPPAAAPAAAS
jgi:hypothetical protein